MSATMTYQEGAEHRLASALARIVWDSGPSTGGPHCLDLHDRGGDGISAAARLKTSRRRTNDISVI